MDGARHQDIEDGAALCIVLQMLQTVRNTGTHEGITAPHFRVQEQTMPLFQMHTGTLQLLLVVMANGLYVDAVCCCQ